MEFLNFTEKSFRELKTLYAVAVATNKATFLFQGHELLTNYAKYLIEYLQPKFPNIKSDT